MDSSDSRQLRWRRSLTERARRQALEEILCKQQENSSPDADLDARWAKARAARNSQQPVEEKTAAENGTAATKTAPAADSGK